MINQLLIEIGLSDTQAAAYVQLVKRGPSNPPDFAKPAKLSRTNAYKVLDQLVDIGLASKEDSANKLVYTAANPVALEAFAKQQRNEALRREATLAASLPSLLTYFFTHANQPGIRFFQGQEEIKNIFKDILRTGQDVYLIRSPADVEFYSQKFFAEYRRERAKRGIHTYSLSVDIASAVHDPAQDRLNKFHRTWLPEAAYNAPVEWDIYGDKTSLISYGEEAIGMIIESPQIADSLRQLFKLIQTAYATDTKR